MVPTHDVLLIFVLGKLAKMLIGVCVVLLCVAIFQVGSLVAREALLFGVLPSWRREPVFQAVVQYRPVTS